jgi:hypothetical protein
MNPVFHWLLADDHAMLEFPECLSAGVGLEMHLVFTPGESTFAWWETNTGLWLGSASAAEA